jgi:hypothetical protein
MGLRIRGRINTAISFAYGSTNFLVVQVCGLSFVIVLLLVLAAWREKNDYDQEHEENRPD